MSGDVQLTAIAARTIKQGDKIRLLKNGKAVRADVTERGVGFAQFNAAAGESVVYADLPPFPPAGEVPENIFNILAALQSGAPNEPAEPPYKPAPQIIYDVRNDAYKGFAHVAISVRFSQCPLCGRLLVPGRLDDLIPKNDVYVRTNPEELEKIGAVCVDCYHKEMSAKFVCDGCGKERTIDQEQWHKHGRNHVRLCTTCYSTLTAQQWDQLTEELSDRVSWED